ncbi:MAG: glycoside hydrolase family 31 protein [Thermoflavifilum sp.]|nr:glycoside hydrolase family 31 protein [Thermoflavifilum sp.]
MQPVAPTNKYSIKYYPEAIERWTREGNYFYFYAREIVLEIRVISDRIIRFRYTPEGRFQRDFSYAVSPDIRESIIFLDVQEDAQYIVLLTQQLQVKVDREHLLITILDREGRLINQDEKGFHWQYYIQKGGKIVYCSKYIQPDECFYGLGDKPTDFNLRGKRLENFGMDRYGYGWNVDPLYKNIPFYYGLHHGIGYGIFFDNTFRTIFDFGLERADVCSFWARGGEMCYYFIYGPALMDVAAQYTWLTGLPELPPLWSLGYHQSRWSYYPDIRVKEVATEFRKRKIPCDVIHLDIDYMDGFRCFTFHPQGFSDPAGLMRELANMGFKVVAIIDPGIKADPQYFVYQQGLEGDYFCKRGDGALMEGDVWPGRCVFPDFTHPRVRQWWGRLCKHLTDVGIRGVWNDMNEPAVFEIGTFPEDVRHDYDGDPCSHRKAHNVYGHLMSKATADGLTRFLMPRRPFVITRSCYAGAQRWTSVWTGDNTASWEHLYIASIQCLRLSISGISFAGSDIGGFIGEPTPELYVRWLQMATFHVFMRTHSASNETGFQQEPWSFGQRNEFIARKFIRLRYRLLPYLYTTFWQYHTYGFPMLRPLMFMSQDDPATYDRVEEFMLGDHLLVSPVREAASKEKEVYLPRGKWYHIWNGKLFDGQQLVKVATPLSQIPLFVRAGAVMPYFPPMEYVPDRLQFAEMTLEVYYAEQKVESILYEDEGDGYGYRAGQYRLVKFETIGQSHQLHISRKIQGAFQPAYTQYYVVCHGLPFAPIEYVVDGMSYKLTARQSSSKVVSIRVPADFQELIIR